MKKKSMMVILMGLMMFTSCNLSAANEDQGTSVAVVAETKAAEEIAAKVVVESQVEEETAVKDEAETQVPEEAAKEGISPSVEDALMWLEEEISSHYESE